MSIWFPVLLLVSLVLDSSVVHGETTRPAKAAAAAPRYTTNKIHSPDGIGKFYMGREISWVMGHQAAAWLERSNRNAEENTDLLMKLLDVKPGQVVADIGAGSGYFTRRLAPKVSPKGKVLAVDIQPEMLTILTNKLRKVGITNVVPILGTEQSPRLPKNSVDFALMVDVYHEFAYPYEMVRNICEALKPGGRVAFVEYRMEDPTVPIKRLHKMSEAQVRKEMSVHPLKFIKNHKSLPWQHVLIFEKVVKAKK